MAGLYDVHRTGTWLALVYGAVGSHSGRNNDLALYQSNELEGCARSSYTSQQCKPCYTGSDRICICT